jgi:hypothetical protein
MGVHCCEIGKGETIDFVAFALDDKRMVWYSNVLVELGFGGNRGDTYLGISNDDVHVALHNFSTADI